MKILVAVATMALMLGLHMSANDAVATQPAVNPPVYKIRVGESMPLIGEVSRVFIDDTSIVEKGTGTEGDLAIEVLRCLKPGTTAVRIEYPRRPAATFIIECQAAFLEFAPSPGGGADDPRLYSTGDGTRVTNVTCTNPLSCDIANRGREGGFLVRCIGRGPGEGKYVYEFLTDPPSVKASGRIRGRCPRD